MASTYDMSTEKVQPAIIRSIGYKLVTSNEKWDYPTSYEILQLYSWHPVTKTREGKSARTNKANRIASIRLNGHRLKKPTSYKKQNENYETHETE